MGQLLRVCKQGQLLPWIRVHPGSLHGPGEDSAGDRHARSPEISLKSQCIPHMLIHPERPRFTGGDVPAHGAAVGEPEFQDGAGRVSTQHHPQLGQRVQEVAGGHGEG